MFKSLNYKAKQCKIYHFPFYVSVININLP